MARKIVIIGAGAAGVSAAASARRVDREAEITLVTEEPYPAYSRCGLPFVLGREIPSFKDLILYPQDFYRMMKLNLLLETKAIELKPSSKIVEVKGKDGVVKSLDYDSLIVATGARASKPPIRGVDKSGVHLVRTISDCEGIERQIERSRSAVVIGAGLVGLEVASALKERNLKVTVVELLEHVLPMMLDQDMAKIVHEHLTGNGIDVIVGKGVDEIVGDTSVSGVSVGGSKIDADMVILAAGVKPEVELVRKAGGEIGRTGCIRTGIRMQTSIDGVYAAGDCAETTNMITGKPFAPQLGTTAVRQGRVAGVNAAGGYSTLTGVLGSAVTRLLDLEIGQAGLTERRAKEVGFKPVVGAVTAKTRAHYYPGGKDIRVKVVVEPESGRVIGAQIIGGEEVTQRVNMVSIAIQKGLTAYEVANIDTCYSPPVADYWEPFVTAVEMALRKM